MGEAWEENRACRCVPGPCGSQCPCPCHTPGGIPFPRDELAKESGYSVPVTGPAGVESARASDGPCPNPEPCPLHPRRADVVLGSNIVIKQDFRDADPDRIAAQMMSEMEALQESSARTIGYVDRGLDTCRLRPSFALRPSPSMGTAQDMVDACNDVRPAGVALVGIVVQGRVVPWRWRWVEPVALWLLRRAGYEVCQ